MSSAVPPFSKRFEGRDEVILDPELPIIDAHHHLFDRPSIRYMFEDYLEDATAGHHVIASVYVETNEMARVDGPEVLRPLGEVEFANGVAAMAASGRYGICRVGAAIVGHADLTMGDDVADLLDQSIAAAPSRYRGVRMSTLETDNTAWLRFVTMRIEAKVGVMASDAFRQGFRQIAMRGLTFDAGVFHSQLGDLGGLADEFPDTTIVVGNTGIAMALDLDEDDRADVFRVWRRNLGELAQRSNVVCKVGGFGLPFWGFGYHERPDVLGYEELALDWAPYVETAVEAFGVERCMMVSDFPPDGRSFGFVPVWNALKYLTRGYSRGERLSLFRDTAANVYRIEL